MSRLNAALACGVICLAQVEIPRMLTANPPEWRNVTAEEKAACVGHREENLASRDLMDEITCVSSVDISTVDPNRISGVSRDHSMLFVLSRRPKANEYRFIAELYTSTRKIIYDEHVKDGKREYAYIDLRDETGDPREEIAGRGERPRLVKGIWRFDPFHLPLMLYTSILNRDTLANNPGSFMVEDFLQGAKTLKKGHRRLMWGAGEGQRVQARAKYVIPQTEVTIDSQWNPIRWTLNVGGQTSRENSEVSIESKTDWISRSSDGHKVWLPTSTVYSQSNAAGVFRSIICSNRWIDNADARKKLEASVGGPVLTTENIGALDIASLWDTHLSPPRPSAR